MTNSLIITITNPDLLAELARYGDPPDQQRIAESALRIGLRALRHARGEVDANSLQQTAEHILVQLEQHVQQHLDTHSQHLLQQFSLDHDGSALNRLAKQQHEQYEKISTLFTETMTRKQVLRRTTQGGSTFEEAVGILVSEIAWRAGDHFDATGTLEGKLSRSKVGDFVITLGNDCAAAGERVVVEAKRDRSYTRSKVLAECKIARDNRAAQVALFVWDREAAASHPPLMRYGQDVVVVWDEQDPTTDSYVTAAYWLARSMVAAHAQNDQVGRVQEHLIADAFDQIVALSSMLDQIKKSGEQIVKHGQLVTTQAVQVQAQLAAQVESLRALVMAPVRAARGGSIEEQDG